MYSHLTINHCLFSISEKQLMNFKRIASYHQMNESFNDVKVLNNKDTLTTVLQVWCLLNEDKLKLLPIPDKMMPYTSNYYILSLIRINKKVRYFIECKGNDPNIIYILSYYLTITTLQWCNELMVEYNLYPYLGTIEQPSNYYLFLENKQIADTKNDEFYIFQKKWNSLIAINYTQGDRFEHYISKGIEMTNKHLLNKNIYKF